MNHSSSGAATPFFNNLLGPLDTACSGFPSGIIAGEEKKAAGPAECRVKDAECRVKDTVPGCAAPLIIASVRFSCTTREAWHDTMLLAN